ncbi:hypothetical protein B1H38_19180 [Leptospira borgpetersenii serovar Ballum]|nr:hypothetical protein B1H38_19180 [Leptospira borgpetersenii serovar Ballum]
MGIESIIPQVQRAINPSSDPSEAKMLSFPLPAFLTPSNQKHHTRCCSCEVHTCPLQKVFGTILTPKQYIQKNQTTEQEFFPSRIRTRNNAEPTDVKSYKISLRIQ